jgi:hypothetical protein
VFRGTLWHQRAILREGLLYISFDNERVGELQAGYAVQRAPRGRYVLIGGSPADNNALLFHKGQMSFLQPYVDQGEIAIAADQYAADWQSVEALKIMENSLTRNDNRVAAVVASNDGLAGGAIQALAEQGLAGKIVVTGQDAELSACQRIVGGMQSGARRSPRQPHRLAAHSALHRYPGRYAPLSRCSPRRYRRRLDLAAACVPVHRPVLSATLVRLDRRGPDRRGLGVAIERRLVGVFTLMGLLAGAAGVVLTARVGSATPNAGQLMELDAIAAVFGGTSLLGGQGSVWGALWALWSWPRSTTA